MQTLPNKINPTRLAEEHTQLKGTFPLANLPRLKALLPESTGDVTAALDFSYDEHHTVVIHLQIDTVLTLQCQRCMENFPYPLTIHNCLSPVKNDEEAAKMRHYEPLLTENGLLMLHDALEDEILLNLPLIPKHAQNVCPVVLSASNENEEKGESPFKILLSTFKKEKEE